MLIARGTGIASFLGAVYSGSTLLISLSAFFVSLKTFILIGLR